MTTLDAAQSQDVHLEHSIENDLLSFGLKKNRISCLFNNLLNLE